MKAFNIRETGRSMRELSKAELKQVAGGAITAVKENGGENRNPAGHAPPGQN